MIKFSQLEELRMFAISLSFARSKIDQEIEMSDITLA